MGDHFKAQDFIVAIPGSGGIIRTIARRVGCTWNTAKKYISEYPTVRQAYEDECASIDDLAETRVIQAIQGGDIGTAKWWLEKRRRDRFGGLIGETDETPLTVRIVCKTDGAGVGGPDGAL